MPFLAPQENGPYHIFPLPTISTACPECCSLATPNSTSSLPTPQKVSHTEVHSCMTYICMGTGAFPSVFTPGVTPSSPVPASTPQVKIYPTFPQILTSKSHSHIIPSQFAQQILFSSFPNAQQISPQFCSSVFPVYKPALCWLPLPDSSLNLLSQPYSPLHQPHFWAQLSRSLSPSSKPPTQPHCFLLSALYSASLRFCTSVPPAILVSPKLHWHVFLSFLSHISFHTTLIKAQFLPAPQHFPQKNLADACPVN